MPDVGQGRATQGPRARRLRDLGRAAAGQAGRPAAARGRRGWSRPGCAGPRGSPGSTSPARASSTSPSTRPPRASWPGPSSRPATAYGRSEVNAGHRFNLEFVSANPTGPLHLGHVRWAAVGDALGRVLQATGAEVVREYYFNDAGVQIDRFALSLLAAAQGRADPRGRLRRRLHRRHRGAGRWRTTRPPSTGPRGVALAPVPPRGHGADVRRDPPVAGRLRRALRRLLQREGPARQGRAGRRAQAADRRRSRLRAGRRHLAAHHHVRRRQGPGPGQGRRRLDLLRRGLRLLPGQARARLRQGRDHARRRPPRLRRPLQGAGRRLRRRPRRQLRDPDRPAGQPLQGRPAAAA